MQLLKIKLSITLLVCILTLLGCDPDPIEIRIPQKEQTPDSLLIWKTPLHPDTLESISIENLTYFNGHIVTSQNPMSTSENEKILCYDAGGKEIWSWQEYASADKLQRIPDEGSKDGLFYFTSNKQSFCLDIQTGTELWRLISEYGSPRITANDHGLIFKAIKYSQASPKTDSTSILMADIRVGDFKEIFKLKKTEGDGITIPRVASYISDLGDVILIFQSNTLFIPLGQEVIDLYSYNLTKKEIMWKKDDLVNTSWNVHLPVMDDENIYFGTKFRFFSIDKLTGAINWERLMPHDYQGSNYLLYEDLLITNLDNGDLIAISKYTGETVWHNKGLGYCCTQIYIFEDKVYIGNGDIYIVDARTGDLLYRYKSSSDEPNPYIFDLTVDTENNRIYATDSYYLLCLEHPEL